jgi:hypothetical protein
MSHTLFHTFVFYMSFAAPHPFFTCCGRTSVERFFDLSLLAHDSGFLSGASGTISKKRKEHACGGCTAAGHRLCNVGAPWCRRRSREGESTQMLYLRPRLEGRGGGAEDASMQSARFDLRFARKWRGETVSILA